MNLDETTSTYIEQSMGVTRPCDSRWLPFVVRFILRKRRDRFPPGLKCVPLLANISAPMGRWYEAFNLVFCGRSASESFRGDEAQTG